MHVHAHAGTRVHAATSLTGLVPERVQLTVHTTEPTGTVPEPFHCDHIARWLARSGTSGRSGTGLNTGNWNGSGTVLVSNLWCEHGLNCMCRLSPALVSPVAHTGVACCLNCCRLTCTLVVPAAQLLHIIGDACRMDGQYTMHPLFSCCLNTRGRQHRFHHPTCCYSVCGS